MRLSGPSDTLRQPSRTALDVETWPILGQAARRGLGQCSGETPDRRGSDATMPPVVAKGSLSWVTPEDGVPVTSERELRDALLAVERDASDEPVIVSLEVEGATLTHVVGDRTGSSMVYFPATYRESGEGSMHSVGDAAARDAKLDDPPQVAYMNGHYSEMPRWMVVPTHVAVDALARFMLSGGGLPDTVEWEHD